MAPTNSRVASFLPPEPREPKQLLDSDIPVHTPSSGTPSRNQPKKKKKKIQNGANKSSNKVSTKSAAYGGVKKTRKSGVPNGKSTNLAYPSQTNEKGEEIAPRSVPSLPGAYAHPGISADNGQEEEVEVASNEGAGSNFASNRDVVFHDEDDEEDPYTIRATLVEEEEQDKNHNDSAATRTTSQSTSTGHSTPPIAHAEPWNKFLSKTVRAQQEEDDHDTSASTHHSEKDTTKHESTKFLCCNKSRFCTWFLMLHLLLGAFLIAFFLWILPMLQDGGSGNGKHQATNNNNNVRGGGGGGD